MGSCSTRPPGQSKTAGDFTLHVLPGAPDVRESRAAPEGDLTLRHLDLGFADGRHSVRHRRGEPKGVRGAPEETRRNQPILLLSHQLNPCPDSDPTGTPLVIRPERTGSGRRTGPRSSIPVAAAWLFRRVDAVGDLSARGRISGYSPYRYRATVANRRRAGTPSRSGLGRRSRSGPTCRRTHPGRRRTPGLDRCAQRWREQRWWVRSRP